MSGRVLTRSLATVAVALATYFALPLEGRELSGTALAIRVLALLGCLPALSWLIARQVRLAARGSKVLAERMAALLSIVSLAVVMFASVAYLMADQFEGLVTKVDALYFSLTTLATVGYGDITATGQAARVVVIVQMLFNLLIVTTAVSLLGRLPGPAQAEVGDD
ncbi:MAG: two pore domain potassium channel family protein [Cellulomonadaceae bacterium]|nr:two pore domain potassium channel family protein [Cellulomonadaceae bacterium]